MIKTIIVLAYSHEDYYHWLKEFNVEGPEKFVYADSEERLKGLHAHSVEETSHFRLRPDSNVLRELANSRLIQADPTK